MASSPSRPVRRAAKYGGAALFSAGVLAVVAGAAFGGARTVLESGIGLAALGVVATLYGLGGAESGPAVRLSRTGLVVAAVAVLAAPVGSLGVAVAVPGGPWGLLYAAGASLLILAETVVPTVGRLASDPEPPVPEPSGSANGDPTIAVVRDDEGEWTWRLQTPDGRVLARAPREYDTATAAHGAASRATGWVGGDVRVVTETEDREEGTPADRSAGESDDLPAIEGERSAASETASVDDGDGSRSDDDPDGERREFVGALGAETGVFELDETDAGWRWRLRYGGETVVAESPRAFPGLDATRRAVERVRTQGPGAGALTYDPGAFEVYREAPGEKRWSWRLRDDDGEVVAVGTETVESRGAGFEAVERVKAAVEEGPAVRSVDGHHQWVLRGEDGVVARSPHGFDTEDAARAAFEGVAEVVPEAGVLGLDPAGFEVTERPGNTWGWRLRHSDGRVVAESPAQATRERAIEGLRTVQQVAPDADVTIGERETARIIEEALSDAAEARSMAEELPGAEDDDGDEEGNSGDDASGDSAPAPAPTLSVVEGDGWEWHLRRGDRVLARAGGVENRGVAVDAARATADAFERATVVRVDPLAVEVYPDDGWRWRLVDGEGILVRSPERLDRGRDARRAAETALDGDLSPEVYRGEGWRFRLRRDGDVAAESARDFETPGAAREAAASLPIGAVADAPVVECESALEVTPSPEGWRFRLRTPGDRVVVESEVAYETAADAAEAAESLAGRRIPVSDDGNPEANDGE